MDTTLLVGILAGLGSGFLTSFLTSVIAPRLDSWFKFRAQRRKVLNKAAFELHILHNSLSEYFEPAASKPAIFKYSMASFNGDYSKAEIKEVVDFMFLGIEDPSRMAVPYDLKIKLAERMEAIIEPIVEVDPILAFRIKKRHGLSLTGPEPEDIETADNEKKAFDLEFDRIRDKILARHKLRTIKSDLHLVTFSLGLRTYLNSISAAYLERSNADEYYTELYKATFDDHFKKNIKILLDGKRAKGSFPPHPKVKSSLPESPTPSPAD